MLRNIFAIKFMKCTGIALIRSITSIFWRLFVPCVSFLKSVQKKILQVQHLRELIIIQYCI